MSVTIDRIDNFLTKLDEKHQKNILGKELSFLLKTESDEVLLGILDSILQEAKNGGKEYDDFFNSMLKKHKVKTYKDLPKDKQTKFFNDVDKKWKAKKETD